MINLEELEERMNEAQHEAFGKFEGMAELVKAIENKWGGDSKNKKTTRVSLPFEFLMYEEESAEYTDHDQYILAWSNEYQPEPCPMYRICYLEKKGKEVTFIRPYMQLELPKRKIALLSLESFVDAFIDYVRNY